MAPGRADGLYVVVVGGGVQVPFLRGGGNPANPLRIESKVPRVLLLPHIELCICWLRTKRKRPVGHVEVTGFPVARSINGDFGMLECAACLRLVRRDGAAVSKQVIKTASRIQRYRPGAYPNMIQLY